MEQLKNQVVMINGISYFITDDITGLDLNTDLISADDQNHDLTFIQNTCENPQGFDLTDEFFGVIEGLPAKPKIIYSKGADNIQSMSSLQDVVHTTIPVTFDLTDIEKPISSDELSSSIQKPHIVHKQSYNINTKGKNQFNDKHSSEPVIITVKPKVNTLPSLKKDEVNTVENMFTISYNTKIQTSNNTTLRSEKVSGQKLESTSLFSPKVPFSLSRESSSVKEQASFLSSFSDGAQIVDTQKNKFGNILSADSEILKPLGSSENPIQLIQKGAKFHSLQPLSQEQVQQVAAILRQQNRKDLLKNTENIVFDKKTNTKIVCKIVYPESSSVKKRGRRVKMSPLPVDDDNKDGDEKATDMLKIKRTRYGRLSKPPRHVVKGLKRFSKLDEEGNEDESSDGECSEEEITASNQPVEALPDIPVKKKRKICTNYRCLTCGKVYLGINKLAKHYCQNPDHGTFEQHLEYIAKNPLYTQDLPANVEKKESTKQKTKAQEPIIQITKPSSNRQPFESEKEEIDSDPVVEALRPKSRKRGRPRKDDGYRKICVQKHNLITAATPLTTFDAYMTLIPRLVEIEPFQHLVSCAKAKRILESQNGSVVPFVLDEVEKLLKDLRNFLDSLLSEEELLNHERIKVTSEIIRQCCQLDDCMYYLKDGNKKRPSKLREVNEYDEHPSLQTVEVSESVVGGDEESNDEASEPKSGKVDDIENESDGSISNLFISDQKEAKDNDEDMSYFKLNRNSEPEKTPHDSVFELFRERKESLSVNDLQVDTAALRQVDDIVDQVASEAGEVVSPVSDYQNPHSVQSYRSSPVSTANSSKNPSSTFKSPNNQNNIDIKSEKRSHEDVEDLNNKTKILSNIEVVKDSNPFVNIETSQKIEIEPLSVLLRPDYSRESSLENQEHNLYTNSFSQLTEGDTVNSKVDGDIDGPFDNSSSAVDGALISLGFNSDSWWS